MKLEPVNQTAKKQGKKSIFWSSIFRSLIFRSLIFWSFRSLKKIDPDRIALIDLLIRLIVIDLIFRSQKISNSIEKCIFCMFLTVFPLIFQKIESLPSIFSKDRRDRFALIDLWKRSTVIEWIPLIFKKDRPWANQSRRSFKK